MATFQALDIGKKFHGIATFRRADGTPGVIYGDLPSAVTVEVDNPAVASVNTTFMPAPADNAYANNPVHIEVTLVGVGDCTITAIATDADPNSGNQELRITGMVSVAAAPEQPSEGGEITFDENPLP